MRAINLLLCLDVALGSLSIVCREQLRFFQWRTARLLGSSRWPLAL